VPEIAANHMSAYGRPRESETDTNAAFRYEGLEIDRIVAGCRRVRMNCKAHAQASCHSMVIHM
jgi:hypothetical protein